ncbi:thioesterase domain-containing protein [Burkholderia sp. Ac-20379]|uniref:thioesterase domain-containing protein n=1 Tax=Burkholderia sp. Ac-20379 TaxID=2703900 RepID=UPI00198156BA|nr:thioesterase domain-containing protein [Burkholderia sp. Ac-20379]MBN3725604.1 hypothetical protein [Burkholderia sp. Ac-20379]
MTISKYLVPVRGAGELPPLFLVHSIAAELSWLSPLANQLPKAQPVYGFSAPGLNSEAPFFHSLPEMAAAYLHDLRQVQPRGPYRLGGYSFGGTVAFEMARQLDEAGECVELLVLVDAFAPAPGLVRTLSRWADDGLLLQVVSNLFGLHWKSRELLPAGRLPAGDLAAQTEIATRHLLAHCTIPHSFEVLRGYLARCQAVMRQHAALLAAYRPQPFGPWRNPPLRSVLLHNTRGLIARGSALRLPELPDDERDPPHGWEAWLPTPPERFAIDCEHFMLARDPALGEVARVLQQVLHGDAASRPVAAV